MRAGRSVSRALPLVGLSLVLLGADRCPLREMVFSALADHEARLGELESCSCCCDGRFALVCGDDGHSYLNACEAECAGVQVVGEGPCEPASECEEPNPAGCVQTGCPDGEVCFRDGTTCVPSACTCDPTTGTWICTDDCGGGVCIGGPQGCPGANPAGCGTSNPCPEGQVCFRDGSTCLPSACFCDEQVGTWICTEDCGGGVCLGGRAR